MPQFVKDKEFKNLMNYLLNKNPLQRLYKLNYIKNHPWFASYNWESLINMSMTPPYIPQIVDNEASEEILLPDYLNVSC